MAKYSRVKQSGDVTNFTSTAELPLSGLRRGETAFANNSLYISNGSGWYRITLVNESPSITLDSETVSLGASGNTVTVGYTVVEPEGTPVNVSLTTTANSSQANITLNSSNNSLTIENLSAEDFSANVILSATDGVNIGTDSLVLTVAYISELWDETVLSIGASSTNSLNNSTFIDRSTNAHTVTPSGTPTQTAFHPYLDNWSVEFDGTDDYLTFADDTNWDFVNSGDFTVDSWIYPRTTSNIAWFGQSGGGGSRPDKWGVYINDTSVGLTAGTIGWHLGSNGNIQGPSFTPTANTWYHIRLGRAGDVWYFFVDGVLLGTATSAIRPSVSGGTLRIGSDGESYRDFNGYLSNVRIVKGTNLNTTSFTPITENLTAVTNTVLLICQSNRFVDNSSNSYTATFSGTPKISAFNPFGQESEYAVGENKGSFLNLNGGNQYIAFPPSAITGVSGTAFTIEMWVNPQQYGTDYGHLLHRNWTGNNNFLWSISPTGYFSLWFNHTSLRMDNSTHKIPLKSWSHIALVRDGNNFAFLLNGERIQTGTTSANIDTSRSDLFYIGAYPGYNISTVSHNAYFSDFKVTGSDVYDITNTTYTVPTAPVGNTSAEIYLPMDNAGIFDKTGNHTLTLVGDTSTSTTQTKFADTAMYFDGSDYITIENVGDISNDFTMEGWFYISGTTGQGSLGQQGIIGRGAIPGDMVVRVAGTTTKVMGWWLDHSDNNVAGTTPLSLNSWYHFALVRNGTGTNNVKLYLNGTLESQGTTTYSSPNENFIIGRVYTDLNSEYFNGYIENLQILKGVAKYTTNFTPPNRTQGITYQAES